MYETVALTAITGVMYLFLSIGSSRTNQKTYYKEKKVERSVLRKQCSIQEADTGRKFMSKKNTPVKTMVI